MMGIEIIVGIVVYGVIIFILKASIVKEGRDLFIHNLHK